MRNPLGVLFMPDCGRYVRLNPCSTHHLWFIRNFPSFIGKRRKEWIILGMESYRFFLKNILTKYFNFVKYIKLKIMLVFVPHM